MALQPEAFFLPAPRAEDGQRFCLFYPAQSAVPHGLVLYVHPFAEEMNKARRMASLQSRALAQTGYAVLQMDLLGCGDSSGDFGDAIWQDWVSDVLQGCHWLRRRTPSADLRHVPLWLWGLRAGCLLAVAAARQLDAPCNFLFWQPPGGGKPLLQQFLRLKVAGDLLSGRAKDVMAAMHQQLANGASVEVAGYSLSPGLASGLEQATLAPPASQDPRRRLEWFDVSSRADPCLSPASAKTIAEWQRAGFRVGHHLVSDPAFWQTSETEEAPALIAATTAAVCCD